MPTKHVLLILLAGPMQSWGTNNPFTHRGSEPFPTKSGVLGLCCAALGKSRNQDVSDLARLRFGVRIDKPGVPLADFHTVMGPLKASGTKSKDAELTVRTYLSDAQFIAGLEGTGQDRSLLERIHEALAHPAWQVYLGRKSFPPGIPPYLKDGLLLNHDLETAFSEYPVLLNTSDALPEAGTLLEKSIVVEQSTEQGSPMLFDQPAGNTYETRSFLPRGYMQNTVRVPLAVPIRDRWKTIARDPTGGGAITP